MRQSYESRSGKSQEACFSRLCAEQASTSTVYPSHLFNSKGRHDAAHSEPVRTILHISKTLTFKVFFKYDMPQKLLTKVLSSVLQREITILMSEQNDGHFAFYHVREKCI